MMLESWLWATAGWLGQCRAAHALIEFSQNDLAAKARVGESTVRNFETGRTVPVTNNLEAIQRTLEVAGIEFIAENGGGPGVRLRKPQRPNRVK